MGLGNVRRGIVRGINAGDRTDRACLDRSYRTVAGRGADTVARCKSATEVQSYRIRQMADRMDGSGSADYALRPLRLVGGCTACWDRISLRARTFALAVWISGDPVTVECRPSARTETKGSSRSSRQPARYPGAVSHDGGTAASLGFWRQYVEADASALSQSERALISEGDRLEGVSSCRSDRAIVPRKEQGVLHDLAVVVPAALRARSNRN